MKARKGGNCNFIKLETCTIFDKIAQPNFRNIFNKKMILEKSMKGKLFVENLEDKARFTIKL